MKNKVVKIACMASVLVAASATQVATAGVSANAAATSNYVWRGLTQSANLGAISGGLDYESSVGVYAGTWVSDTAFDSQELDVYAGWSTQLGPIGLDVGAIAYIYPQFHGTDDPATANDENDANWVEAYVGVSATVGGVDLSGQLNVSQDVFGTGEQGVYGEVGAEMAMPGFADTTVAAHVGSYTFAVDANDANDVNFNPADETGSGYDNYVDVSLSLAHKEWTFTVSDTTLESDNNNEFDADDRAKFTVTYAKDFTLLK